MRAGGGGEAVGGHLAGGADGDGELGGGEGGRRGGGDRWPPGAYGGAGSDGDGDGWFKVLYRISREIVLASCLCACIRLAVCN